jgi:hypothetical protein
MAKSISVTVTGNAAPLRKELKRATQDLSGFAKAQRGFGDIAKLGYAVAGASVVRFGQQLVKAAMDDEKSQALLRDAISKTTYATDTATASAEAFVKQLSLSSNIADDDLRPALSTLTRATGDVTRAQTLLALSTEIATATGKDLASVSMAVAKASLGSTTALGKLGVPLSEGAKQSGNFALAFEELNAQFGGSNAAALNTAAGRLANLSLRFDELKESLGSLVLPAVDDVTKSLTSLAIAAEKKDNIGILAGAFDTLSVIAEKLTPELDDLAFQISDAAQNALGLGKEIQTTSEKTGEGAGSFRLYDEQLSRVKDNLNETQNATADYGAAVQNLIYGQNTTFTKIYADRVEEVARQTEAAKTRAEKAAEKFKALGQTLKGTLNTALEDARNKLQAAKDEMKAFGDATASAITGNVSIGDALSGSTNAENTYTEALKRRADAYQALNIAKATGDIGAYTRALDEVSSAEEAVSTAQSARRSPGQLFADQIAKAKKFATDLKTLISPPFNLSEAGLSQLINLGIESGSSVAAELVAGTGSLSVGAINEGLAGIGSVAGDLGTSAGSIFRGGAVGAAQTDVNNLARASVTNNNNSYSITITSGVGDEVEIGKSVVKYLQAYDKKFSGIPIKVKK